MANDMVHTGLTTVAVLGTNVLCRYFFEDYLGYTSPFQESSPCPDIMWHTLLMTEIIVRFECSPFDENENEKNDNYTGHIV